MSSGFYRGNERLFYGIHPTIRIENNICVTDQFLPSGYLYFYENQFYVLDTDKSGDIDKTDNTDKSGNTDDQKRINYFKLIGENGEYDGCHYKYYAYYYNERVEPHIVFFHYVNGIYLKMSTDEYQNNINGLIKLTYKFKNEINKLKEELLMEKMYKPGGSGYQAAKEEFEHTAKK